ncbi:MAG: Rha family transcriptional regulator [Azonexus sp.]|jgi:Rha family phage regulatory protein|nr:Rha family transcriptional regulator [Azonexus sp.]
MNAQHPDLFPETLLVQREGERIYTTSRKVAERFKKRHDTVLRTIKNLLSELNDSVFADRNFAASTYTDSTGRCLPEYHLTHDGFALLAMGFTGREALLWKIRFLNAFRDMERQLAAALQREANALYAIRPRWRAIMQHPDYSRAQLIGLTGHASVGSITACRRRMRDVGLFGQKGGVQ